MTNPAFTGTAALRASLFTGVAATMLLGVTPAFAQTNQPAPAPAEEPAPDANAPAGTVVTNADGQVAVTTEDPNSGPSVASQEVVVTGSRIRRPNLDSPIPVTTVQGEEFFEQGKISIAEELNELPQLRSSVNQQNSTAQGFSVSGLNLLDLRGLGTGRTLVLVNGRRHVGSDILVNATSPDVNTIPTALVQRVDVVTGGNSAIYGSDAIAGVVNFVLRRDFDGIEARAQAGTSKYGDANTYFASITAGRNFAGGRGNIAFSGEYARQDEYYGFNRDYIRTVSGFLVVDTDPAGTPSGSDGNPDRVFFRDIKNGSISNTGTIQFGSVVAAGVNATNNCGRDPVGNFYNCPYIFQPDGTLVPITGTRVGLGPTGSFIGGNGENFQSDPTETQLSPNLDRYVANLLGRYEFSDALELFGEAKYARIDVLGAGNSGPGFIISQGLGGDVRQGFRLDNPFLTAQARGVVIEQLNRFGVNLANGAPLTAAERTAIANGTFRVRFQESFLNLGRREVQTKRETYRAVVGARGTFNDDWSYEISGNYGQFDEFVEQRGAQGRQRLLLALDAGRNPVTGAIECRSKFDPAARVPSPTATGTPQQIADTLAADIAACVPINPLGGQFTQAQADYINIDSTAEARIRQWVANAFVAGDTSQFFELPGGPIGFALGAEYRRETNAFQVDELTRRNLTYFNPTSTFTAPALTVKEVFGEVRLPLLKDLPFVHDLTVNAAGRYASYGGAAKSTGNVTAWNLGAEWSPVSDVRFRVNKSKAVRSPNLSELYTQETAGFAPAPVDPCSARNIGAGAATRAANCAALGVPTSYDFVYPGSITIRFGGNRNLKAETSKSLTIGGVVQPRYIPGLSISVDYFDIKVKDVITSVTAQNIIDRCVDLPTIDNPFCALFQRNRGPGTAPGGEIVGQILNGTLLQSTLNFASRRARGIDAEIGYRTQVGRLGRLDTRLIYTHNIQRSNFENPSDPKFENALLKELNTPQNEALFRASLQTGVFNFAYNMRFIGRQYLNTYEDYNTLNGLPPQNIDYADTKYYPPIFYHGFRFGAEVRKGTEVYLGVDNAFDTEPPLGLTGIGAGSGIYENRGRFFYGGIKARF